MTDRERWLRTYRFQEVDHVPDMEFGYWDETFPTWHKQGLPQQITDNGIADRYFGFTPMSLVPVYLWPDPPPYEEKIIEQTDEYTVVRERMGVTEMRFTDGSDSIPRFLNWELKGPEDWERFKAGMNPDDPRRYPDNWDEVVAELNASTVPVQIDCGSLFGRLRDWMGFENILIACMDQPDFIEQMMEDMTNFLIGCLRRAVEDVRIDAGLFWEDMCFSNGPMISPRLFREWMTPRYKRITDFVKQAGTEVFIVDCDGDITQLVEHWLAGGVNCMFPLEIAAGTDPYAMRREFGREVLLLGGVNKRALAQDKAAIRREVDRIVDLVADGGYIPHVDHRCPPDVSYENYLYYLKTKREALGIPDPWADGPPDPNELELYEEVW